jgi:ABC-type lipoprotein export system ATPase subunit
MENTPYQYFLPDLESRLENLQQKKIPYGASHNAVIIIGANGSGKSRLGAWMEKQQASVHRISAQRNLSFDEYIQLRSLKQSEDLLLFGSSVRRDKFSRWENKHTTKMITDYEYVLSMLIAKKNKQHDDFIELCNKYKKEQKKHCEISHTVINDLIDIWDNIFPQRIIKFDDAQVKASINETEYNGKEMSDGERVALYLIAQCLCIPQKMTIIVDEPELHLHRSIMNKLWMAIEKKRQDCLFIYITHDTQFAASHNHAKKIWTKKYNGTVWDWEFVKDSELPEQCLLDILGNRKNILFVEGDSKSFDTKLYQEIYFDYHVVPCGSCTNVILYTKAMKKNEQLHHLEAYGIIDRDYRSENELNELKKNGIFSIQVSEIENIFCVKEILSIVNEHQGFDDDTKTDEVEKYIIDDRYAKQIESQKMNAVIAEIKFKLSTYDIPKDECSAKKALDDLPAALEFDNVKKKISAKFDDILASRDYKNVLAIFNEKGLAKSIGHFFQIKDKDYCELVVRLCKREKSQKIISALLQYLPHEIPVCQNGSLQTTKKELSDDRIDSSN